MATTLSSRPAAARRPSTAVPNRCESVRLLNRYGGVALILRPDLPGLRIRGTVGEQLAGQRACSGQCFTFMDIWIGTSGFQYAEWKGNFYPEDLPTAKMLPFYAER